MAAVGHKVYLSPCLDDGGLCLHIVSHHWTIDVCPTVTNHYAEFRPWRRDLTFKTRPLMPVRRPVLPL
ncbi:hypothetical protein AOLI_G00098220 [Acnodon oligacanthus]